MTETLKTGIPAVDRYLMNGYDEVREFSSVFAATICGHLLRRQSEMGVHGSVAEIGTFEGRFSSPWDWRLATVNMPTGSTFFRGPAAMSSTGYLPMPTRMACRVTASRHARSIPAS
jgi:hypothetical protein